MRGDRQERNDITPIDELYNSPFISGESKVSSGCLNLQIPGYAMLSPTLNISVMHCHTFQLLGISRSLESLMHVGALLTKIRVT